MSCCVSFVLNKDGMRLGWEEGFEEGPKCDVMKHFNYEPFN